MTAMHTLAACLVCPWEADGRDVKDADQLAHIHTTTKARGTVQHATVTRTHPTTHCAKEGCHR